MTIHCLQSKLAPELAAALEIFERQFTYPLGSGRTFRISHGEEYPRFFRSLGDGACFVAEENGLVKGVIGVAVRRLALPGGELRNTLYVGDVKVDASARGGMTLLHLGESVLAWLGTRVDSALGIVMDGTVATPDRYTGRFGIPHFDEVGCVTILRVPTVRAARHEWTVDSTRGFDAFRRLASEGGVLLDGDPTLRSEMEPTWLLHPSGAACGRLEDTRRAKRLIDDTGQEMRSAHLSSFAFESTEAAVELLHAALDVAARLGHPALFVAIPNASNDTIAAATRLPGCVVASATLFAAGLAARTMWFVNTSEI